VGMQRPTKRARYEDEVFAALLCSSGLRLD
jgi:hypothetical protein